MIGVRGDVLSLVPPDARLPAYRSRDERCGWAGSGGVGSNDGVCGALVVLAVHCHKLSYGPVYCLLYCT